MTDVRLITFRSAILRKVGQNFVLHAIGEEGVRLDRRLRLSKGRTAIDFSGLRCDRARSLAQDELVGQQQDHGHGQHRHDPTIDVPPRLARFWLQRRSRRFALQTLRCPLIEPGEENPKGEADRRGHDDPAHQPIGDLEEGKDLRRHLHQEPRARGIKRRRPDDIAPLQLGEEVRSTQGCFSS